MDAPKSRAPAHPTKDPAPRLPDHELIMERLRLLREYELGARVEDVEGSVFVRPVEEG